MVLKFGEREERIFRNEKLNRPVKRFSVELIIDYDELRYTSQYR